MTASAAPPPGRGLDDVVALQSRICRLSALDGRLGYRGYDVRELGERSTFEETAFLLLYGELPTGVELRELTGALRGAQKLSLAVLRSLRQTLASADPMGALRVAISVLALEHAVPVPPSPEAALGQGLRLVATIPTLVAALARIRRGERPLLPKKSLSFAANFLAMLTGVAPSADAVRALDAALILRADNELNPSTFAARVTAATGADVFAALLAAWSAALGTASRLACEAGPRRAGDDRDSGTGGRLGRWEDVSRGENPRIRAPGLSRGGPADRPVAESCRSALRRSGPAIPFRYRGGARGNGGRAYRAISHRGLLPGAAVCGTGDPAGILHPGVRGEPDARVGGAHSRAIHRRTSASPASRVYWCGRSPVPAHSQPPALIPASTTP